MHRSFSAVNENADENAIPFSAENENESHLFLYRRTYSYGSVADNIFGPTQMTFLERKRKIKQK